MVILADSAYTDREAAQTRKQLIQGSSPDPKIKFLPSEVVVIVVAVLDIILFK
jgi:hypothetical protein